LSDIAITFVSRNGQRHEVRSPTNRTLMEAATKSNVPGIDAECGGSCACATCHVYVDEQWTSTVGQRKPVESEMIEFSSEELKSNSRLACQIVLTNELDGLVVYIARA